MILVTGASGNVGGQVLRALQRDGQPVRALYRNGKDATGAPARAETVIADFADRAAIDRALSGVDKVFLVCAPVPELVALETNVIDACKSAGTTHLVLSSALGAGVFHASFPAWHAQVEAVLKSSGTPYTIIRPNSFMQNLLAFYAPTIRGQGVFYASMGKARASFIDTRDIGDFVAKLFSDDAHKGQTYELNGPEALNYDDVAALVSSVAGKPVRYVDLPSAQLRQSMLDSGMPQWQVDALLELQRYYIEGGGGEVDDTFLRVVGREPRRLSAFLKEFATEFGA